VTKITSVSYSETSKPPQILRISLTPFDRLPGQTVPVHAARVVGTMIKAQSAWLDIDFDARAFRTREKPDREVRGGLPILTYDLGDRSKGTRSVDG
jgi:hypothetical protein